MVSFTSFIAVAAVLSRFAVAVPLPDSSIGEEVGVSAPNGIVMSDTAELFSQTATASSSQNTGVPNNSASSSCQGSGCNSTPPPCEGSGCDTGSSCQGSGCNSTPPPCEGSGCDTGSSSSSSSSSYSPPMYGSGSSSWGSSGYNDCVQQCIASFGSPPSEYVPPPTSTSQSSKSESAGSVGNGATITVIVAPTQGVLRFVPFTVNAAVGDTIMFMWNANNHTVTKSSELLPCNKTVDSPFASGEQNKGFMFTQVVNDTNPTYFYCGTPGHCEKGMFGIINPPSSVNSSTSVANSFATLVSNSSILSAMATFADQQTSGNDKAANWGSSIDLAGLPDWSHSLVLENTLYTRAFLGNNPDVIQSDGSVALGSNPLMFPTDVARAFDNTDGNTAASSNNAAAAAAANPSSASSSASSSSTGAAPSPSKSASGASALSSSSVLFTIVAIIATLSAL